MSSAFWSRVRARAMLAGSLACAAAAWLAAPAPAQTTQVLGPWDGTNPFNCAIQNVGTGTDFPDPDADPFCVEFDKNSQSLLPDAGLVDFLVNEPFRVAAAAPKCFYYQRDHWTGALIQGQPPELWHWDGSYFFDKAKGVGGVHVENFRVAGQPTASMYPFVPDEYKPFFSPTGGGGVLVLLETNPDPTCVAAAEQGDVYANQPQFLNCISPGGELKARRVGHVRLGMSPEAIYALIGQPHSTKRGVDRWCVIGDGELRVDYRKGSPKGAALTLTTVLGHTVRGVGVGTKRRKAIGKLDLERAFKIGKVGVFEGPARPKRDLFVGIGGKRVAWLAITNPDRLRSLGAAKRALRRAR
jgi:hypothetical protein